MWAFATGLADECSEVMELDAFGALFERFERSAFRVEARGRYWQLYRDWAEQAAA